MLRVFCPSLANLNPVECLRAAHQEKLAIAQKLLKEISDIELIAKVTDLSVSELEKIKKTAH